MEIRLVMEQDRDALMSLFAAHAAESVPHLGFSEPMAARLVDRGLRGNPTIFVAESNGQLVGHVVCQMYGYYYTYGHSAQMEILYVRPEKRGSRAAVSLVDAFLEWAETVKARETMLQVLADDPAAPSARLLARRAGADLVAMNFRRAG